MHQYPLQSLACTCCTYTYSYLHTILVNVYVYVCTCTCTCERTCMIRSFFKLLNIPSILPYLDRIVYLEFNLHLQRYTSLCRHTIGTVEGVTSSEFITTTFESVIELASGAFCFVSSSASNSYVNSRRVLCRSRRQENSIIIKFQQPECGSDLSYGSWTRKSHFSRVYTCAVSPKRATFCFLCHIHFHLQTLDTKY